VRFIFEGWRDLCKITATVELDNDDIATYAGVDVTCIDPGYIINIYCSGRDDRDELTTECFNRVLDLATRLLESVSDSEVRYCKDWHDCTVVEG
jgi:hypothetical protein